MSALLTPAIAEQAVALEIPKVLKLISTGVAGRDQLYILVAKRLPEAGWGGHYYRMVHHHSIGVTDDRPFEGPFVSIAEGKARISGRTGLPSRLVQATKQYLLVDGDVRYGGSWTGEDDGIIVAASGFYSRIDEVVAKGVHATILALIEELVENDREAMERDERDGPPDEKRFCFQL